MTNAQAPAPPQNLDQELPLAPPRPNLGPEPVPDTSESTTSWRGLGFIVVAVALSTLIIFRRRTLRASDPVEKRIEEIFDPNQQTDPLNRVLLLAEGAKNSLVDRFGESWRAKTTEEMAIDPRLASIIDAKATIDLIELLKRADVLKFAVDESLDQTAFEFQCASDLEGWEKLLASLICGDAGARSTING